MSCTNPATAINGTISRQDGLRFIFLGASVMLALVAYILFSPTPTAFHDFRTCYFAARTLLHGRDPYNPGQLREVYQAEFGKNALEEGPDRETTIHYIYPPTSLPVTIPFAILPWRVARVAWMLLSTAGLILASLLAWDLAAGYAPTLSGAFIGFLLANSLVITALCNPSGLAIGLCVISTWCFLRNRFVIAGVLLLALSLAIKPQDPGFVWLYFLLAGGLHRKRALYSLLASLAIGLPFVLWTWHVVPHWIPELHSNLLAFAGHGGLNDPGPASTGPGTMVNLQVFFSWLRDDPRFYNPASYLTFAVPFALWVSIIMRTRFSLEKAFLAIAAVIPLSMLPLYHQLYGARMLLLTVPAFVLLCTANGLTRWLSLLIQSAAFFFTGDVSAAAYRYLLHLLLPGTNGAPAQWSKELSVVPVPLVLLAMATFYLWAYFQYSLKSGNRLGLTQPMVQS